MPETNNDQAQAPQEPRRTRGSRSSNEPVREKEQERGRSTRPVRVIRLGRIRAAVWANQTDSGMIYNTTFERLYKPDGEDQWKSTDSFGMNDLLLLAKVADLAHTWICQHRGPIDSY